MPDQRLTAKNGTTEVALGAVIETDTTPSLQVADRVARDTLVDVRDALTGAMASLTAASEALTLAANAEQVQADVVLANVASLIAAAGQIQTEANTLLAALNEQLDAITDTQAIIQTMATAMQLSFSSLEDVRSLVQSMLNSMGELLASAIPQLPIDPVGSSIFGEVQDVASGIETTLVSFTVPAGESFVLVGFTALGNADGRFRLYIGVQQVLGDRTSAASRTARATFPEGGHPRAGQNLEVRLTVEHAENAVLPDFEGYVHGHFLAP